MNGQGWAASLGTVLATGLATYQMAWRAPEAQHNATQEARQEAREQTRQEITEQATQGILELMRIKDQERDKLLALALKRCDMRVAEVRELLGRP